jgi:hypothetical protein
MVSELKLRAASLVTDRVRVEIMTAMEELQKIGRHINDFGIFQEAAAPCAALAAAREAIVRAEKIMGGGAVADAG